MCLLPLHGRKSKRDVMALGVRGDDPTTYRPEVLWYFGHLARLDSAEAVRRLRSADRTVEIEALTFNVVELSGRVLRKHRYVNAGWMFTALALITLAACAGSLVVRA
jgi:aspartyl/asparaginyl beta-hydroxylase (cupin superfamily)